MDVSTTIRLSTLSGTKDKENPPTLAALAQPSDEVLMEQLVDGNREALAILFRRYARTVRAIAYRALHDASEADDLVQDVFILVHRDAKAFDSSKGSARVWILQISHRRAISRHRYLSSRHFYSRIGLDDLASEPGDPQAFVGQAGNPIAEMFGESDFKRVFDELSPNQRETLRLHFFDGYSLAEIATVLGQSRGNIKHHYFRGLERLRKQLLTSDLQCKGTVR
jgi:RNA polymerase sigma-70 factor (ECF subfamily)